MTRTWIGCMLVLITARGVGAQTRPVDATDAALDRPIHDVRCVGLTLTQAVELISRKSGVACRVDPKALEGDEGPDKVRVGDFRVRGVTARVALEIAIDQLAAGHSRPYVDLDPQGTVVV